MGVRDGEEQGGLEPPGFLNLELFGVFAILSSFYTVWLHSRCLWMSFPTGTPPAPHQKKKKNCLSGKIPAYAHASCSFSFLAKIVWLILSTKNYRKLRVFGISLGN